jgi:D-tyrosyl-tRNA(Tyr) deacylase
VDSQKISSISHGLLVLIGISSSDTAADLKTLTNKILSLRLWPSLSDGTDWRANVKEVDGEVLCVSQFTLHAKVNRGNKPDFHGAMVSLPVLSIFVWLGIRDLRQPSIVSS